MFAVADGQKPDNRESRPTYLRIVGPHLRHVRGQCGALFAHLCGCHFPGICTAPLLRIKVWILLCQSKWFSADWLCAAHRLPWCLSRQEGTRSCIRVSYLRCQEVCQAWRGARACIIVLRCMVLWSPWNL